VIIDDDEDDVGGGVGVEGEGRSGGGTSTIEEAREKLLQSLRQDLAGNRYP